MTPISVVTVSGKLAEIQMPLGTETVRFVLLHDYAWTGPDGALHRGSFRVCCIAWGHAYHSLMKYGRLGLEVLVSGRLAVVSDGVGVMVDSLAFTSPREAMAGRPLAGPTRPEAPNPP